MAADPFGQNGKKNAKNLKNQKKKKIQKKEKHEEKSLKKLWIVSYHDTPKLDSVEVFTRQFYGCGRASHMLAYMQLAYPHQFFRFLKTS